MSARGRPRRGLTPPEGANVFLRSVRGGRRTPCTSAAARVSRKVSVNRGSRSWIKKRFLCFLKNSYCLEPFDVTDLRGSASARCSPSSFRDRQGGGSRRGGEVRGCLNQVAVSDLESYRESR